MFCHNHTGLDLSLCEYDKKFVMPVYYLVNFLFFQDMNEPMIKVVIIQLHKVHHFLDSIYRRDDSILITAEAINAYIQLNQVNFKSLGPGFCFKLSVLQIKGRYTLMVFLKESFEKLVLKKYQRTTKKA